MILKLSYSPKTTTLERKFGNMPIKYLRTTLESEEDFTLFTHAAHRYNINISEEDDDDDVPDQVCEVKKLPLTAGASSSSVDLLEDDRELLPPPPSSQSSKPPKGASRKRKSADPKTSKQQAEMSDEDIDNMLCSQVW